MNYDKIIESNNPFLLIESTKLLKKLSRKKRFSVLLLVILATITILIFANFLVKNSRSSNKILISRESTLNAELTKMENINDLLEAEILILKKQVKDISNKKDEKKLKKISKYLADTDLTGTGVEIKLKDNLSIFGTFQDEKSIVHNTDLLKIVNFLWENGASAISINGERIVFNSYISCVGPTILINKKRISSPFSIKAVGEKLDIDKIKNNSFVL